MKKRNGFLAFTRQHKYEIITFTVNICAAFSSLQFKDNLAFFVSSVIIFVISLFVAVYLKTRDKDFYYLPLNKPGKEKDWVGRGKFSYIHNEKCFEITNSNAGYLFPKTILWDDYRFEFDFKIINEHIAWIIRAGNLSNYIMFQCAVDGINPHIRVDGDFVKYNHRDINFTFINQLNFDTWYRAIIICEKRSIRNTIYQCKDGNIIFDRHWKIPENELVIKEEGNEGKVKFFQNIDFDFGAIGFRNYGDERGFVKNIYVERL